MDGFINIDKPSGWTSHDVVAHLRSLLRVKKIGHTGTLDPAAIGVLPICIGKATKLAQLMTETDKEYRAVMRLGVTTDTQDATGKILERRDSESVAESDLRTALKAFRGEIFQTPPMFSAVKVGGQPLYRAARAGREVRRPPRRVTIHRLEMTGTEGRDVSLEVACSKGTYIRTLCADIGERLGVGAHLYRLVRSRSGPFRIENAVPITEIDLAARERRISAHLIPPEVVLAGFPCVRVTADGARGVLHGVPISLKGVMHLPKEFKTGEAVLVYNNAGHLIALASALVGRQDVHGIGRERVFKVDKVLI